MFSLQEKAEEVSSLVITAEERLKTLEKCPFQADSMEEALASLQAGTHPCSAYNPQPTGVMRFQSISWTTGHPICTQIAFYVSWFYLLMLHLVGVYKALHCKLTCNSKSIIPCLRFAPSFFSVNCPEMRGKLLFSVWCVFLLSRPWWMTCL